MFDTLLAYTKWRKKEFTRSSPLRRSLEILDSQAQAENFVPQQTINEIQNEEKLSQLKSYFQLLSCIFN